MTRLLRAAVLEAAAQPVSQEQRDLICPAGRVDALPLFISEPVRVALARLRCSIARRVARGVARSGACSRGAASCWPIHRHTEKNTI